MVWAVVTKGSDPPWKNPPPAPDALTFGGATVVDPPKAGPDGIGTAPFCSGPVYVGPVYGSAMIMPF